MPNTLINTLPSPAIILHKILANMNIYIKAFICILLDLLV